MTARHIALGAAGEAAVAGWYAERGYEVLARNWRCSDGELDLVLRRHRTVVICEVKTRTSTAFGSPVEAVTAAKQARIRRLAYAWLQATGTRAPTLRFDVAEVVAGEITVLEDAF